MSEEGKLMMAIVPGLGWVIGRYKKEKKEMPWSQAFREGVKVYGAFVFMEVPRQGGGIAPTLKPLIAVLEEDHAYHVSDVPIWTQATKDIEDMYEEYMKRIAEARRAAKSGIVKPNATECRHVEKMKGKTDLPPTKGKGPLNLILT